MSDFERVLTGYREGRVLLVDPSGGNVGDALILLGTKKLFSRMNLDYEVKTIPWKSLQHRFMGDRWRMRDYDLVVLRGGGYVNDVWYGGRGIVKTLSEFSRDFVIAPQSCWMGRGGLFLTLKSLPRLSWFFCREMYSYDAVRSMKLGFNVGLSQDCVFYLSEEDLELAGGEFADREVLYAFREDSESARKHKQRNNIDLGKMKTISEYVGLVKSCHEVYTDRLHVACVGAILGKRVHLYDNIYWKNRGVYEYSLSKFPNVKFCEE